MLYFYIMVVIKLIVGFCAMLFYLNASGKKRLSEMTPINFIGNFILSTIMGGSISSDMPFIRFVLLFAIVIGILLIIEKLATKINLFKEASIGHPIPIIKNNQFLIDVINDPKYNINMLNVAKQLRLKGINNFHSVYYAQIETTGELTVITTKEEGASWIIILNGVIMTYELGEIGKDEQWMLKQLKKHKIKDISEIFMASYYKNTVTFVLNDGRTIK